MLITSIEDVYKRQILILSQHHAGASEGKQFQGIPGSAFDHAEQSRPHSQRKFHYADSAAL